MRMIRTRESHRSRVRACARSRIRARIRACIHSSEGDDDGRLYRVYHGVRSPWYMTQRVVYGHGFRYISKIRVRGVRSPRYMTQCVVYGHEYRCVSKIRV
jgi:hypothetical protein